MFPLTKVASLSHDRVQVALLSTSLKKAIKRKHEQARNCLGVTQNNPPKVQ